MKARLPNLHNLASCLILSFLLVSCASDPPAREESGKQVLANGSDDELDGNAGAADEDALDSGMGSQIAPGKTAMQEPVQDFTARPRTKYQVIQNGFDRANVMPTVDDFDPLDEPSPRVMCLSTRGADPNTVSEVVIKQMMVQIPGTADYGPLFPGSRDHVETRLVIGKNNGWVNSQNLTNDMRQVFDLAKAPGSLVIRIHENKYGIYQDIGAPAEVWIRKDAHNRLFFKVYRLDAQRTRTEVFIGYCYPRGLSPEVIR
jgi:hypothetical protein